MKKPLASLSLDLDNKWSYLKTHGDESWEEYPSYFGVVVPRILSVLEDVGLRITFFVVGQDATLPENHAAIRSVVDAGHEIGNHSFRHEPWLHLYDPQELEEELKGAGLKGRFKTMVGGAPVTQRWANRIGADAFAEDAIGAVSKAKAQLEIA